MLLAGLSFIAGVLLLVKGADWLVEGASDLAKRLGVSDLSIGLTVVAFGTSMPELIVNVVGNAQGASDLVIGDVIGSNIANTLLILGVAAVVAPVAVKNSTVWNEIPLALLAAVVLMLMANDRVLDGYPVAELSRSDGYALLGFFLIYLWYIAQMRKELPASDEEVSRRGFPASAGLTIAGMSMLLIGGVLTVDGAVTIAEYFGISQALIGLTAVAVGTSLPELATAVVAAKRGKADIAVGNVVGSNIFNIFWILGLSAAILPVQFDPSLNIDAAFAIFTVVVLFFAVHTGQVQRRLLFWRQRANHVIERSEGIVMLTLYGGYLGFLLWRG